ncbi:hypothetical protein LINPERPRIM_LOCUS6113 [Linum perenne]
MEKKKVMVAIDESEFSHYALEWALSNLGDTISKSSAPLLLFTAQPFSDFAYLNASTFGAALSLNSCIAAPELVALVHENQKKVTIALLDKAKQICSAHGVTILNPSLLGFLLICDTI